jgi:hypothetical protein
MGDTDITGLVSGDVFTIEGVDLQPYDGTTSTQYTMNLDDEGAGNWTYGYNTDPTFPYESADGNLRIISGSDGPGFTSSGAAYSVNEVGNINL